MICEEIGDSLVCRERGSNAFIYKDMIIDPSVPFKAKRAFITHGHVDHFLYAKHYEEVYAPKYCLPFVRFPEMNYVLTVGFVEAPPQFEEVGMEAKGVKDIPFIHVPGHTYGHYAYLIETSIGLVLVTGDTVFGDDYLEQNTLLYHLNTKLWIESLSRLEKAEFDVIVPGHGSVGNRNLVLKNLSKIEDMVNLVYKFVSRTPKTDIEIFEEIVESLGLKNRKAYPVYLPTIRAILGYLKEVGKIRLVYDGATAKWSR